MRIRARIATLIALAAGWAHGQEIPPVETPTVAESWSAGTDVYYLRPHVSGGTAYHRLTEAGLTSTDFVWEYERAHAFWAAFALPNGFGARARLYIFDADPGRPKFQFTQPGPDTYLPAGPGFPTFRAPSDLLTETGIGTDFVRFRSPLRLLSLDVEATLAGEWAPWSLDLSLGARNQLIRQEYEAYLINPGTGAIREEQTLRLFREFTGVGPTASLSVRRAIVGSWSGYGNVRGALLFGDVANTGAFLQTTPGRPGPERRGWSSGRIFELTVPVTEVEAGVEYRTTLGWLGVFLRGGVVAQTFYGIGGPTGGNGPISLFGGQFSAGVSF